MKTRSPLEICLPLVILIVASLASLPTFIISVIWLTIGICSVGYRSLGELPDAGIPRQWLHGPRSAVLWFYHLAWWPWYMRFELHALAARIGQAIRKWWRPDSSGSSAASRRNSDSDET
ncbi:hypothetical protein [Paraburkholderia sp. MM6662-R1]|uniref:hypothetical protein n=1 Tax=Paraburkholderia sp. MM6662-R1 TaxID=2991066 RepID=UPI003D1FB189